MSAHPAPPLPRWLRLVPPAIVVWLLASWPIGLALDPERLARPGESAYLVADLLILLPLAVATFLGLRRGAAWGVGLLVAMLGALAYDATHFAVRTVAELSNGALRLAVIGGLVVLLVVIGLGVRSALRAMSPSLRSG
jgi:Kef-type K+ transport system membrane component KefB